MDRLLANEDSAKMLQANAATVCHGATDSSE